MKRRVLLVEDEPGLVMTLTDRLSEEGPAVGISENGWISCPQVEQKRLSASISAEHDGH